MTVTMRRLKATKYLLRTRVMPVVLVSVGAMAFLSLYHANSADAGVSSVLPEPYAVTPLVGDLVPPSHFSNPYAQVPAQCYIETAGSTQNACLFCHTNGVWQTGMGNNNPQAGAFDDIGNFQREYSFAPYSSSMPLATINRWENTLYPEKLFAVVAQAGIDVNTWDMQDYLRQDNWLTAYQARPRQDVFWDAGGDSPFRLLPALNPADLPAHSDGFVRSTSKSAGYYHDGQGYITGWRAINFMPYGIFSPQTGSVSGIYIRLPPHFMKNDQGVFDTAIYTQNLDLLAKAIQDRLTAQDAQTYLGSAKHIAVQRGVYPVGTEFAHPLHYVDVDADGSDPRVSRFAGTRSQRVKEVRYMIKWEDYDPNGHRPPAGAEPTAILGSDTQGWVDNGAGWYLVGFIEDRQGALRPQRREELMQCIGCHSGVRETEAPTFTSGVGNTVDGTWAFPRQLPQVGWQEMNYLGYDKTKGATIAEPQNRDEGKGEYRLFLDYVVGANLYGEMPSSIERFLSQEIRVERGYSADWTSIDLSSAQGYRLSNQRRQQLLRQMTARGDYLNAQGRIRAELFYPQKVDALAGSARYRQVVVSQRFTQGKDVFAQTPHTFRAFRASDQLFTPEGVSYAFGAVITARSVEQDNPASATYRSGNGLTEIDPTLPFAQGGTYQPNYRPFIK